MYHVRTDLAIENRELYRQANKVESKGVEVDKEESDNYTVTRVRVLNKSASEDMHKPIGTYITIDVPKLNRTDEDLKDEISQIVAKEIKGLGKNDLYLNLFL